MRKCQLLNYRRPSPSLSISTSRILEIATSGSASLESTAESGMRLSINYVSILGGGVGEVFRLGIGLRERRGYGWGWFCTYLFGQMIVSLLYGTLLVVITDNF